MGNVYMEADQVRFKDSTYRNVQEGLAAALEGGGGGGGTAADVSYDNTDSGLTADDVQAAIDEVVTDLGTLSTIIGDSSAGLVKEVTDIEDLIPSGATSSNKLATASDIPDAVTGNPSGSATAGNLTKLQIGSDVYDLPSGGGAVYSSTEQIAGEWNGKTLYRKLFDIEAHGVEWDTTLDADTPVDFALFECGYIAKTGGSETKYINANFYDANNYAFCYVSVNNDRLHCTEAHSGNLWPSGARVVMSVLYTKKTV